MCDTEGNPGEDGTDLSRGMDVRVCYRDFIKMKIKLARNRWSGFFMPFIMEGEVCVCEGAVNEKREVLWADKEAIKWLNGGKLPAIRGLRRA